MGRLQGQGTRSVGDSGGFSRTTMANIQAGHRSNLAGKRIFKRVVVDVANNVRHAWMSYAVDKAPSVDPILQRQVRAWEPKEHRPVLTWSRSGYKPYSTYVTMSNTKLLLAILTHRIESRASITHGSRLPHPGERAPRGRHGI